MLTIKGSQQEGLTGVKGSMLRKVVVDKTRHALESALASIKKTVNNLIPLCADRSGTKRFRVYVHGGQG